MEGLDIVVGKWVVGVHFVIIIVLLFRLVIYSWIVICSLLLIFVVVQIYLSECFKNLRNFL